MKLLIQSMRTVFSQQKGKSDPVMVEIAESRKDGIS